MAPGLSRTEGAASSTSKKSLSRGASSTRRLAKRDGLLELADEHAGDADEGDDLADRGQVLNVEPGADDEDRKNR